MGLSSHTCVELTGGQVPPLCRIYVEETCLQGGALVVPLIIPN